MDKCAGKKDFEKGTEKIKAEFEATGMEREGAERRERDEGEEELRRYFRFETCDAAVPCPMFAAQ